MYTKTFKYASADLKHGYLCSLHEFLPYDFSSCLLFPQLAFDLVICLLHIFKFVLHQRLKVVYHTDHLLHILPMRTFFDFLIFLLGETTTAKFHPKSLKIFRKNTTYTLAYLPTRMLSSLWVICNLLTLSVRMISTWFILCWSMSVIS